MYSYKHSCYTLLFLFLLLLLSVEARSATPGNAAPVLTILQSNLRKVAVLLHLPELEPFCEKSASPVRKIANLVLGLPYWVYIGISIGVYIGIKLGLYCKGYIQPSQLNLQGPKCARQPGSGLVGPSKDHLLSSPGHRGASLCLPTPLPICPHHIPVTCASKVTASV